TVVTSGATVNIIANANVAEPFTINGNGFNDGGALRKQSFDNSTYSGTVTLGSAARINAESPGLLRVTGNIANAGFTLTLGGAGSARFRGEIHSTSGPDKRRE